jgi:hypothetical protein
VFTDQAIARLIEFDLAFALWTGQYIQEFFSNCHNASRVDKVVTVKNILPPMLSELSDISQIFFFGGLSISSGFKFSGAAKPDGDRS